MTPDYADLHDDLRAVARDLLATGPDWPAVVRSGWPGLEVATEFDGAGATFAEVAVVLREIGRAAASGPYPSVAAAVGALNLVEAAELLRDTVSGRTVPVLVVSRSFHLDHGLLHGSTTFVPDALSADVLLVPTVEGTLAAVDPRRLTVTEQPVLDATRRFGTVVADGVRPDAVWRFRADLWDTLWNRAAVAVACDSVGLAEAMLAATVAHVRTREQFGRPIGSFQAVQHACADMLVAVKVAGKLVDAAARRPEAVEAAMAKSYACARAVDVVGKAMQLHGGMGYTWDSGVHVYLKRATLNRSLFGSPAAHRKRLGQRYSGEWPPTPAARRT